MGTSHSFEQILEATHNKTAVEQPLTSHLSKDPSKMNDMLDTAEEVMPTL